MIVLDTHALLWWALDPDKLSKTATTMLDEMNVEGGYVSAISIWELGVKIQRGKLEIGIGIEEFARRVQRGGVLEILSVDTTTWLRSLALDWSHRDPADRVIVATALVAGKPLLTCDRAIRDFPGVESVW